MKVRLLKQTKKIDKKLLVTTLLLVFMGLVIVADASAPSALANFSDRFYFFRQQVFGAAIGILVMLIVSRIRVSFWEKLSVLIFGLSLLLLVAVLLPFLGSSINGARRWIFVGPISIQPSEIIKISIAMYMARVASSEKQLLAYLVPMGMVLFLVMLQPDLGTAVVISMISMAQIFVSGISIFYLVAIAGVGGVLGSLLILTSSYRRARLMTYLEHTTDPLGASYHIRQILLALGSGGLFGVGIGQSRQKHLFLPEASTDSIFAVVAEEVGFVGATILILIFGYFVYRGLKVIGASNDKYSQVLGAGLIAWIGGQAFVNIASMVAIVPLTGIPLPFISFGSSSLITVLFATGILLSISRDGLDEKTKKR